MSSPPPKKKADRASFSVNSKQITPLLPLAYYQSHPFSKQHHLTTAGFRLTQLISLICFLESRLLDSITTLRAHTHTLSLSKLLRPIGHRKAVSLPSSHPSTIPTRVPAAPAIMSTETDIKCLPLHSHDDTRIFFNPESEAVEFLTLRAQAEGGPGSFTHANETVGRASLEDVFPTQPPLWSCRAGAAINPPLYLHVDEDDVATQSRIVAHAQHIPPAPPWYGKPNEPLCARTWIQHCVGLWGLWQRLHRRE